MYSQWSKSDFLIVPRPLIDATASPGTPPQPANNAVHTKKAPSAMTMRVILIVVTCAQQGSEEPIKPS